MHHVPLTLVLLISSRTSVLAGSSPPCVFTEDSDVKVIFFYFENALTRKKDESKRVFELLAHLVGLAFGCYFKFFGAIGDARKDCDQV